MDKPTPNQLERWQRTRAKGKFHFVLTKGVLAFGLTGFALTAAANYYRHMDEFATSAGRFWKLAFSLLIWFLIGFFWSLWMWKYMERRFSE